MILETTRLILRPWRESDAERLYEYAKNPEVGPAAGWPVHTSVENSRQIIKDVLSAEESYAVTLKDDDVAIGSIGLMIGDKSNLGIAADEAEIGYWIGEPFWGQGMIPEAMQELMRYAFDDLGISTLWCGYFDGNEKSKRAQEKCGFRFHHTETEKEWPLINAVKTQHVTCMTKQEWNEMLLRSSDYVKTPRASANNAEALILRKSYHIFVSPNANRISIRSGSYTTMRSIRAKTSSFRFSNVSYTAYPK